MRRTLLIGVAAVVLAGLILQGVSAKDAVPLGNNPPSNVNQKALRELEKTLQSYRPEMVRVTDKPFHVVPPKRINRPAVLCAPANLDDRKADAERNPHEGHWIHVFITAGGREPIAKGAADYPEGTIILKQKLKDAAGKQTVFYTGMLKREAGYAKDVGDWEFFTTDAAGKKVTARGQMQSCVSCHQEFEETGYVSREYLVKPVKAGGKVGNRAIPTNVDK